MILKDIPSLQRRGVLAAILFLAALPCLPARESTPESTLDPAVVGTLPEDYLPGLKPILAGAIDRAPDAINASIALAQAEATRYLDSAALWPSLNANGQYSADEESISNAASSTQKGLYYTLSFSQPVYQWGAFKAQSDVGKLGVIIARRQFADAYRTLAITLREQYLGLILKQSNLRGLRFSSKIALEAYTTMQEKAKSGAVPEGDVEVAQLASEEARLAADRADADFGYSKRVFLRLAGLGPNDLADDAIPVAIPSLGRVADQADAMLQHFVADGVQSTFAMQVYDMEIHQSDLNYKIARVRLLPKFSLSANYLVENLTTAGAIVNQQTLKEATAGLAGNWSIFDGFATRGAKLSALATKRLYERQRETYVNSTIDEAENMRKQLDFARRALLLAETHRALYKAGVDKVNEDKKLGYGSDTAVATATSAFYLGDYYQTNAQIDFLSRWTEFISLVGSDPALANLPPRYVR